MDELTPEQARAALDTVERARRQVVDEIDIPAWYWASVAAGWIVLGVIADLDHPAATSVATLAFGAVHSWVAPRVVNGRHRNHRLSVRAAIESPRQLDGDLIEPGHEIHAECLHGRLLVRVPR